MQFIWNIISLCGWESGRKPNWQGASYLKFQDPGYVCIIWGVYTFSLWKVNISHCVIVWRPNQDYCYKPVNHTGMRCRTRHKRIDGRKNEQTENRQFLVSPSCEQPLQKGNEIMPEMFPHEIPQYHWFFPTSLYIRSMIKYPISCVESCNLSNIHNVMWHHAEGNPYQILRHHLPRKGIHWFFAVKTNT